VAYSEILLPREIRSLFNEGMKNALRTACLVLVLNSVGSGKQAGYAPEAALKAAEIEFADSVSKGDFEKFKSFISENAVFLSTRPLRGRDEILAAWKTFFQPTGPRLTWEPEIVVVEAGGRMGITRGPFLLVQPNLEGGEPTETKGTFNSVWERQADGTWKIIFDSGCPPCECP
jgi:ketosteroid isomerase-like protein